MPGRVGASHGTARLRRVRRAWAGKVKARWTPPLAVPCACHHRRRRRRRRRQHYVDILSLMTKECWASQPWVMKSRFLALLMPVRSSRALLPELLLFTTDLLGVQDRRPNVPLVTVTAMRSARSAPAPQPNAAAAPHRPSDCSREELRARIRYQLVQRAGQGCRRFHKHSNRCNGNGNSCICAFALWADSHCAADLPRR